MIFYYIDGSERTSDVQNKTLRIQNQIQQRTDTANFNVFNGTKPSEWEDVKIYDGALVESHSGTSITLQDSFEEKVNLFRQDQEIFLQIDNALEKAEIDSFNTSTKVITLKESPSVSMSKGDKVGEIIFGGTVSRVEDSNVGDNIDKIEYTITCTDYTKIFDKKLINDTWEDEDGRYIINSFINSTTNFNQTIDNISYDNDSAIQSEWTDANDANNPTVDSSDYLESTSSGVFGWTNSGGTADWTATPTSQDIDQLTGTSTGSPSEGFVMSWFKTSDQSDITSVKIQIGSDASNYTEVTIDLTDSEDWQYVKADLADGSTTGTPDWTAVTHAKLIITQTGNGQVQWNGLRVNAEDSFTLFNVDSTPQFDDVRSPGRKPTRFIQRLAKAQAFKWYIDYERDIHFSDEATESAPFDITDSSSNWTDLTVSCDVSKVGNRVEVQGGERISDSKYAQAFEGDNSRREWLVKNKFKNLEISIDDNSSTDTMEAGTTATTVKATGHGLSVGDFITNRTRSNAVREVLTVPDSDTFTVSNVTNQASGDTFSKFSISKTSGIEGIVDETTVDYVQNSNEKSIRATASEDTLTSGDFILFKYNERFKINLRWSDPNSINELKALGFGDGIFDLKPIKEPAIDTVGDAINAAKAKLNQFSNAIIDIEFTTDQKGLQAGQILSVNLQTNRSISKDFLIQTVTKQHRLSGRFKDYLQFKVKAATTLFGWTELLQTLLEQQEIVIDDDAQVVTYVESQEEIGLNEVNSTAINGFKTASESEEIGFSDTNDTVITTPPWKWGPDYSGQTYNTRWNLAEWS